MGIYHLLTCSRAWRRCRSLTAVLGIFFLWLCFISVINPDTSALEPVTRDTAATSILGFGRGAPSSSSSSSSSSSFSSFRAFMKALESDVEYSHSVGLDAIVSMHQKAQSQRRGPLTVLTGGKVGQQSRYLANGLIRGRRIQEIRSTKTGIGTDFRLSRVKVSVDTTGSSPSETEDEQIDGEIFLPVPATQDVSNMQQSIGRDSKAFSRAGWRSSPVSRFVIPLHGDARNGEQFESDLLPEARNLDSLATRYDLGQRSSVENSHQDARSMDELQREEKSIDYGRSTAAGKISSRWDDFYDSEDVVKTINKRFGNDQLDRREPHGTISERLKTDLKQNTFQNSARGSVNLNNDVSAQLMKGGGLLESKTRERTPMQMDVAKSSRSEELPFLPYHPIDQRGNSNESLAMRLNGVVSPHPTPPVQRAHGVNGGNGDSLNVLQSYKTLGQPHQGTGSNGSAPYQDSPTRGDAEVTNWGSKNDEKATIDGSLRIGSRDETTQLDVIDEEERQKVRNEDEKGTVSRDGRGVDEMRQANRWPGADTSSSSTLNATSVTDDATWKVRRGQRLKSDGFHRYAYNVTSSDAIGLARQIPDTRPAGCDLFPAYSQTDLPKASVVICFHNEALSVLLRTVHSVIDRTPPALLEQIILVDDNSTFDDLGEELPRHLHPFGSVVVLKRTKGRQGLTRARLLGANEIHSPVIVFLDAHVECNVGWLEPMLAALVDTPNKVVSPYIDTIKSENFQYKRSPPGLQGGFNWRLEFGWRAASTHSTDYDTAEPIRTPVISGGLFAVRTDYFRALGGYDPDLEIWGGENFELSFKTWMCGGSMEILPCSRVGHVFRASLPYKFKEGRETTVLRNLARVANVWMDEYADFFEAAVDLPSNFPIGDISERVKVHQKLQCKSFQWYLDTVYPQMEMVPKNAVLYGQVKNRGSLMCFEVKKDNSKYYLGLSACKGGENQTLYLTSQGLLKYGEACVIPSIDKLLTISQCAQNFTWIYQEMRLHAASVKELCLVSVDNEVVHILPCRTSSGGLNAQSNSNSHFSQSASNPKHQAAIMSSQKLPPDLTEDSIFQQWTFDYTFNWKRKRRR